MPNETLMIPRRFTWLLIALLFHASAYCGFADRIVYKNGRVREAIVIDQDDDFIYVKSGSARVRLSRAEIEKVIPGTEADHLMLDARQSLAEDRIEDAILNLSAAAEKGVSDAPLATLMLQYADDLAKIIPDLSHELQDEFNKARFTIRNARLAGSRQADLLLAQLLWALQVDDRNAVTQFLLELTAGYPEVVEENREKMIRWIDQRIGSALDANQFRDALALTIELRRIDPERALDRRIELMLFWAGHERDKHNYQQALDIYIGEILPTLPPYGQERIGRTLEDAADYYREQEELGRVIDLYKVYGLEFDPEASRRQLVSIWHELGWTLVNNGNIDGARLSFEQANEYEPGSATNALRYCDYMETKAQIDSEDYVSYYKLGEWCFQEELFDEAQQAFEHASKSDVLRPAALVQLKRIRQSQLESDMLEILDLYESGAFIDVMRAVTEMRGTPMEAGYRQQLEQLDLLARDALEISINERTQQAEVLMQQVERAWYKEEYADAENIIQTLMERFGDTPAAARARQFYEQNRGRLEMDRLERRRPIGNASAYLDTDGAAAASPTPNVRDDIRAEIRRLRDNLIDGNPTINAKDLP